MRSEISQLVKRKAIKELRMAIWYSSEWIPIGELKEILNAAIEILQKFDNCVAGTCEQPGVKHKILSLDALTKMLNTELERDKQ